MHFDYEGDHYVIEFEHDVRLLHDWSQHFGHNVQIQILGEDAATAYLICVTCGVDLANISPAMQRRIKAQGSPYLRRLVDREKRMTHCTIRLVASGVDCAAVATGCSRLNTDAGDTFNRRQGCLSSLRAAIASRARDFKRAAMFAYLSRAMNEQEKARFAIQLGMAMTGGASE